MGKIACCNVDGGHGAHAPGTKCPGVAHAVGPQQRAFAHPLPRADAVIE
jgi:hypothetical protein